jgi:hypothetical protein
MGSVASSILKAINFTERKLNILCINESEPFQTMLASTDHNFYFLQHPQLRGWNQQVRPIPSNCILLSGQEVHHQIKRDLSFDLVLCQNRTNQFQILWTVARQLSCPIIIAENNLSNPNINPAMVEALANQPYNLSIFNSEFLANSWGFDIEDDDVLAIPYGVDTTFFDGWSGGDGKILTIVNQYPQNNDVTGFNIWGEVTSGFQVNPWGFSPNFSNPTQNPEHLLDLYRKASVFLNTSSWKACSKTMLEAMSVGCPVVTTATTTLTDIIEDGVNGFITNDVEKMKENIHQVMNDSTLAQKLGSKARETIQNKFDIKNFRCAWDKALYQCVGQISTTMNKRIGY